MVKKKKSFTARGGIKAMTPFLLPPPPLPLSYVPYLSITLPPTHTTPPLPPLALPSYIDLVTTLPDRNYETICHASIYSFEYVNLL